MSDCAIVNDCNHLIYSTLYDGWAIGSEMQMDKVPSLFSNYEYMLVCLEDNSCFGFETYYTTDPFTAKLIYQID